MTASNFFIITFSFIIALMLTIVPLPLILAWWRPLWMALMVIFWVLVIPKHFGLGISWLLGLLLDTLAGTVLGVHAFGLMLVAYAVHLIYPKMRMANSLQQSLFVLVILMLYQGWIVLIQGMLGQMTDFTKIWLAVPLSAFIWPWLMLIMGDLKYRYSPSPR